MKKNFKYYALIWAIIFAAFNVATFLVHPVILGYAIKYDLRFWIAWAFIIATFIGNLVCTFFAFKAENLKKKFLHLPLVIVSWLFLITTLVVGCVLMLIPNCPAWVAAIICIVVLTFDSTAVIKTVWTADVVNMVDEKVATQTFFIKNLTVDAENLLVRAKSEPIKAECKKVYEAVRYSDPISSEALAYIESEITITFSKFVDAVSENNIELVSKITSELVALFNDRNKKCKFLK